MKRWLKKAIIAFCSATLVLTAGVAVGCSSKKKDDGPCVHKWTEKVISVASCTEEGVTKRTCTKCKETETFTTPASHEYGEPVVVEATCTERGSTTYTCGKCGDSYGETTAPKGHSYTCEQYAVTCTTDGYDEYTCACGDSYRDNYVYASGHDVINAEWSISERQVDGCLWVQVETATCANCPEVVTHEEEFNKHEYVVTVTEGNCSQDGQKLYSCACGDSHSESFKNASGHNWTVGNVDHNTGITTWVCSHNAEHTKTSFSQKDKIVADIPATVIQEAKEIELKNATLALPDEVKNQLTGDVNLSVDTLDETTKTEATESLSAADKEKLANAPIFNFNMTQGTDAVTKFEKAITITVPYTLEEGADPAEIAVWYIDDKGELTSIQASYSVVNGEGFATFETDHFSLYTVVRLTAKERCALYGCEKTTTIIPATCTKDGYTITKCARCNTSTRSNFVKALGHEYTETVVEPTCTAKGYTTYTCTREGCRYSYSANWTDVLAHVYTETVVEPTCTAKGYTAYACACGNSYTGNYVDAIGHNYVKDVCTNCGKQNPSTTVVDGVNVYFNAIESLLSANSYYLEVKDFSVLSVEIRVYGGSSVSMGTTTNVAIDNLQLQIAFDEDGYLVGKGVALIAADIEEEEGYAYTIEATGQVLLCDGMLYVYADYEEDGEAKEARIVISQDAVLSETGVSMEEIQMGIESITGMEEVMAMLEEIKNAPNSPLNNILSAVIEYVYTKTATANGYHYEFNFNRATEVYDIVTTKTVGETLDLMLGAGFFDEIVNYLTDVVDDEVGVVVDDLADALELCGVDIEDVYDMINLLSGMEEAGEDVRDYIDEYIDKDICDLLDEMMEVEGSVDYEEMIMQYALEIKQMPVMELLSMLFENNGGGNVEQGGSSSTKPGYGEDYEEDFDGGYYPPENGEQGDKEDIVIKPTYPEGDYGEGKEEIMIPEKPRREGEAADPVYEMIVQIVTVLKKNSLSFDTTKTGEVLSFSAKLVDFGALGSLEDAIEDAKQEAIEEGYDGYGTNYVKMNGTITIKLNGSFVGSFDNLADMGDEFANVVDGYVEKIAAGEIEFEYKDESVYIDVEDGEVFADVWVGKTYASEEVTYGGKPATKITAYGDVKMLASEYQNIAVTSDCLNWVSYDVAGRGYYETEITVWVDENGKYLGVEIPEYAEFDSFSSVLDFYYNTATGEYAPDNHDGDGMHNYELVEKQEAEGCVGEGYYKYACTHCGNERISYYKNGHEEIRRFVLSEGSVTCEDGIDVVYTCMRCGEELNRWHYGNYHETWEEETVVATTDCGAIYMVRYRCACGEYDKVGHVYGACEFDYVETTYLEDTDTKYSHYIDTYRCAVTACAYTYTIENYYKDEGCYEYRYRIYKYGVKEGSSKVDYTYTDKDEWNSHHLGWKDERSQDGSGLWTVHTYCTACGTESSYYQARYNERGYTTYYKNLMKGSREEWEASYEDNSYEWLNYYYDYVGEYGWRRVYNGCEYVQYDLNGNFEYEGDMHWWTGSWHYSDSCTQYQFEGKYYYCYYCGEDRSEGVYNPPKDHYYVYNEDLGLYVCETCGMQNVTGADAAFVIEDLSFTGEFGCYAIGYYNKEWRDYEVKVVANYGTENDVYLSGVGVADLTTHANSGIVTINMETLELAIDELQQKGISVETISVVMQYYDSYTDTWLDCVVTFD